ncbi:hypothetical protein [Microbacterium invictum]|uniref:Uncharacterized protein n=1 Tax=Microbacterium invictum TaxID=515415 RepID=A0ABZ0VAL7_9MICO|nr:hypothetical protein [Microbacterium invictum]WQB70514.1 hypothetical protein T9R20_00710 [Microbacterium invictum]
MTSVDDRLSDSDPARELSDAALSPQVLAMWERAQSSPPVRSHRRRWRIAIPVIVVGLVATGAAIAFPIPTTMNIGEQGTIVEPDARIPINYTTLTGTEVSCQYLVYLGDDVRTTRDSEVAAILGETDWTGIGQDIYDYAINNPRGPVDGEVWTNDSPEMRDTHSFILAVQPMFEGRLPADMQGDVGTWRMTSTCEGPYR